MLNRVACLLAVVVLSSGCAALRASAAKRQYIESQTQNLVITKPLDEVWPSVQQVIFSRGFQLKQTAALGSYSMETETKWNFNATTGSSSGKRYLVQGVKVDDKSCRVNFTAFDESQNKYGHSFAGSNRDWEMEFDLLKQVDPNKAAEIEAEAENKAQAAANQG